MVLTVREDLKEFSKDFEKSEDDLKSLQSGVGQIVGEVLRQLTEDKCECIVLASVIWFREWGLSIVECQGILS